jgi:LuxR family transcriptional regulator, quorum-sensing system regulator SdiA
MGKRKTLVSTSRRYGNQEMQEENKSRQQIFSIEQLGEMVPGIVMLQNYKTHTLNYINSWGCKFLSKSLENLREMGKAYFEHYLHPEDVDANLPKLIELLEGKDSNAIVSFFLRVRQNMGDDWHWFFHTAKIFDKEENPGEVIIIATPIETLSSTSLRYLKLVDEREFAKQYREKFNLLTNREKEVIRWVAEGKNSKEIAELLFISVLTVEQHRKNIKKKTGIKSISELIRFVQSFDFFNVNKN